MKNNLLPEGFKDEVTTQAAIEHKYKNKIINLFQSYGYELVKTPLVEFSNQINLINSLNIKVRKNEDPISIRDDITMQVARLASSRLSKNTRPLKLCYYGEVVRNKGSMLRPERQFLQIGAECIGENSFLSDVEMIQLAYLALNSVGVKNISIELSSKVFLDKVYQAIQSNKNINKIKSLIRKKDLSNALKYINKKHHIYLKNIFSCTGSFKIKQKNLKKLDVDNINKNEIDNLINIFDTFSIDYPGIDFFLDLTEIDDKNYHNSIRFTIFAENVRGEIARGGRYISKQGIFEENSTGFTCYMDTILRASSKIEKNKKILIPFKTSIKKKNELIKKKYIIETFFGNKKDIKKIATLKNCQFYLFKQKIFKIKK